VSNTCSTSLIHQRTSGLVARVIALLALCSVFAPASGAGQEPDSLVALLGSPDWRTRGVALARLNELPLNALPSTFRATAIALLEREATSPDADLGRGEGYGEYQIHLITGVLRLDDPRSLRGMALLGMRTSRKAKEFVARQGASSLPYLDEAWEREPRGRHDVVITWGYMLGPYGGLLGRRDTLGLIIRLLRSAREEPDGFAWAADIARLAETVPLVERIARSAGHEIVRRHAATVAVRLRAWRDSLSTTEFARRFDVWVSALCVGDGAAKSATCEPLVAVSADAINKVRTAGVRGAEPALDALVQVADHAFAQGSLDDTERALVVENAKYLKTRP